MAPVDFEELPFKVRPDLTPYLIHLTKGYDGQSALENLTRLLRTGVVEGTRNYVKGQHPAACFMDVPLSALKYVCAGGNKMRYEPYGILITKETGYRRGLRPVLYLSDEETAALKIPGDELWRVVKLEVGTQGWVSWLHEREWRCRDQFELPPNPLAALVRETKDVRKLQSVMADDFKAIPKNIIPLSVVCQGLSP